MSVFDLDQLPQMVEKMLEDQERHAIDAHAELVGSVQGELVDVAPKLSGHLKAAWQPYVGDAPTEVLPKTHTQPTTGADASQLIHTSWRPGQDSGHVNNAPYAVVESARRHAYELTAIRRAMKKAGVDRESLK